MTATQSGIDRQRVLVAHQALAGGGLGAHNGPVTQPPNGPTTTGPVQRRVPVVAIVIVVVVLVVGGYAAVHFTRHGTMQLTHAACVPGSWTGVDYYDNGAQELGDPGTMSFGSNGTGSYHASYVVLKAAGGAFAAYDREWTFRYTADAATIHLTGLTGSTFITNQQTGLGSSVRAPATLDMTYVCGHDQLRVNLPEYSAEFLRH
jgi:hypothetical protein